MSVHAPHQAGVAVSNAGGTGLAEGGPEVRLPLQIGTTSVWSLGRAALVLVPAIALGIYAGKRLIGYISQDLFEYLVLAFAAIAALRMIGLF